MCPLSALRDLNVMQSIRLQTPNLHHKVSMQTKTLTEIDLADTKKISKDFSSYTGALAREEMGHTADLHD